MIFNNFSEYINEGKSRSSYDGLAGRLTSEIFKQWVSDWKYGEKESTFDDEIDDFDLQFDVEATLIITKKTKGFEVLGSTGADAREEDDKKNEQTPFIIIDFAVNPDWLPVYWSEMYMHLADVVRHEIEHITQDAPKIGNYRTGKPIEDDSHLRAMITQGLLPSSTYLTLPKEIDANLQGLRFEAKKRKTSMSETVNKYLDTQNLSDKERTDILELWRKRAQKISGIPNF